MKKTTKKFLGVFYLCFLFANPISAQIKGEPAEDYLGFLAKVNTFTPLESAGAHGLHGIRLGAGGQTFSLKNDENPYIKDELGITSKNGIFLPKLWLTKGLFYPLDAGLSLAKFNNDQLTQVGAYLQWSLFESFALPALAIRLHQMRLLGLKTAPAQGTGVSLLASWGIGIISAYGGVSLTQHKAAINNLNFLSETNAEDSRILTGITSHTVSRERYQWSDRSGFVGVNLHLFPPFVVTTLEAQIYQKQPAAFAAKLSMGI